MMVLGTLCKLVQRQTYTCLSHRYGTVLCFGGLLLLTVSAFQFGEVMLEWSKDQYAAMFSAYHDNIASKSFQDRLCLPVPIDVVYTWVNGTDPKLLEGLRRLKMDMELEINKTKTGPETNQTTDNSSKTRCKLKDCVSVPAVVLVPPLPSEMGLPEVRAEFPVFLLARSVEHHTALGDPPVNITVIKFSSQVEVNVVLKETVEVNGVNVSLQQGYLTSDWTVPHSVLLKDTVMVTHLPRQGEEEVKAMLEDKFREKVASVEVYLEKRVAVMDVPDFNDMDLLLKDGDVTNVTIGNDTIRLTAASLAWDLTDDLSFHEDIAPSRFEDNEELRYSLRSIERYAPWVRHVYIVTNGQIPSWLNLDNPRLTIVTHSDLFPNASHLPSFSSPAIEAHLHRIPGLSNKFIYLNDDVMFGAEVWPDDFYTHSQGQKVYLAWPVPNCADGCPSSWIRDNYCDKACNNSECEWDGGDCLGAAGAGPNQVHGIGQDSGANIMYCNPGCANNWLADRYCDQACNVLECGFDAGDCGTVNFDKLTKIDLQPDVHLYHLKEGEHLVYFNLSAVFPEGTSVTEGKYDDSGVIRAATVAQKFKTLNIVLFPNKNASVLHFNLTGKNKDTNEKFNMAFNLTVDTKERPKEVLLLNETGVEGNVSSTSASEAEDTHEEDILISFQEVPEDKMHPKVKRDIRLVEVPESLPDVNNMSFVPEDLSAGLKELEGQLDAGELTEKGYKKLVAALWKNFPPEVLRVEALKQLQKKKTSPAAAKHSPARRTNTRKSQPLKDDGSPAKYPGIDAKGHGREGARVTVGTKRLKNLVSQMDSKVLRKNDGKILKVKADEGETLNVKNEKIILRQDKVNRPLNDGGVINMEQNMEGGDVIKQSEHESLDKSKGENISTSLKELKSKDENNKFEDDNPPVRRLLAKDLSGREAVEADSVLGSFLPWEKQGVFSNLRREKEKLLTEKLYQSPSHRTRQLTDTFADSLRHSNRIFNKAYGFQARKVPAHMPHMIDVTIMTELQEKLPEEFDETSSHKIRHSKDMQFAFSYFYYLMSEKEPRNVTEIFDSLDTDKSGILSDRELRTMAARLNDLPLALQHLTQLEQILINCSASLPKNLTEPATIPPTQEHYYEPRMPLVTKSLVLHCHGLVKLLNNSYKEKNKFKYEVVSEDQVAFKMIRTNVSQVIGQLDDIRKNPKKFVCLNDNIDHKQKDAQLVKAVIVDFYEAMFPLASQFELPREYRNRFLHMDELREWRAYRDWLRFLTHLTMGALILFSLWSFCANQIAALKRRFWPVLGRRNRTLGRLLRV
ncbi:N-acetylglucosamine-1-phosphotransferase subunits alpha/beta-like isoform X1 [Branchiostoma floridae x Branchiostoma belcheri]